MPGEFSLIDRFFGVRSGAPASVHVPIGIGDDCAAIRPLPGHLLLTSVDTFNEGVHFFSGTDPSAIGHKALAVNLSDLAACGAEPLACLLALSLPQVDETWLSAFAKGFRQLADANGCVLAGGDTTRSTPGGGISISVTVFGQVPDDGSVLRRSGAAVGDDIWVSGPLGAAAWTVARRRSSLPGGSASLSDSADDRGGLMGSAEPENVGDGMMQAAALCLDWPQPRVALGLALRGVASACIDLSDGLTADLGHVLSASGGLGATLQEADIPFADVLQHVASSMRRQMALSGGDDYELCFTVPPQRRGIVESLAVSLGLPLKRVGCVDRESGLRLVPANASQPLLLEPRAYEHF